MTLSRRDFIQAAAAIGASLAWGGKARASRLAWREKRELYPEGVASGDPDPSSVILWTRRPFGDAGRHVLTVEVAEDEGFRRVVAQAPAQGGVVQRRVLVRVGSDARPRTMNVPHDFRPRRRVRLVQPAGRARDAHSARLAHPADSHASVGGLDHH